MPKSGHRIGAVPRDGQGAEMPDSALAYYEMYMRLNPANPAVINKAAKIHLCRKEYAIVLDMAENYLQIDSTDMDIRGLQGLAYFQLDNFRKSEEVFQKMEDDGNDSYSVHIYLGQNQWRNKKHISALKELQAAWQIDSGDVNLAYSIGTIMGECGMGIKKPSHGLTGPLILLHQIRRFSARSRENTPWAI